MRKAMLLVAILWPAQIFSCEFNALPSHISEAGIQRERVGSGKDTTIKWLIEIKDQERSHFPEDSDVRIKHLAGKSECAIREKVRYGWEVYLSDDERTLLFETADGSSTYLEMFNTDTCKFLGAIDVTGGKYQVNGERVIYEGFCEPPIMNGKGNCAPAAIYSLGSCKKFEHLPKESLELTKEIFGVSFSRFSVVESPYTKKARVLKALQ